MIIIKNSIELSDNKSLIDKTNKSNYQQTYENILSIHLSNNTAITFIDLNLISTFIKRNDDIYECATNIEPIVYSKADKKLFIKYIKNVSKILNSTLYFPLVYENSEFYKLLNKDLYNYERLYTSISNHKLIGNDILKKVLASKNIFFSMRNVKKFEGKMYIKYFTKIDVTSILSEIENNSWKHIEKQDMLTKKEQLVYYSELIKSGIATIAVTYLKETNELVSYRIDAIYDEKVFVLKNSYKEEYKKYSPGSYMLIYDLFKGYPELEYIDLYGGPGLTKDMIETSRIKRYDMLYGNSEIIDSLENNRRKWDLKNYNNYINGKSIKEVFKKKENIIVATSCFGLGPVGKLNSIIECSKDSFNWFATGEQFDINIFDSKKIFIDTCFSLDEKIIKKFIEKYNIKYAVVVLKNKIAHLLVKLGVKVIYVDSLPFMWSSEDAKEGKIPYEVDCYCAQKTIELSTESQKIFAKVKNLHWIEPIINVNNIKKNTLVNLKENYTLINLGGLHSPSTNGIDYVDVVLIPLLELMSDKIIYITTSSESRIVLNKYLRHFKNVSIMTLEQNAFWNYIDQSDTFITSPGLTTILESSVIKDKAIFLPPQNISQFYNIEYAKKIFKSYKELTWNNGQLTLLGLKKDIDNDEKRVIEKINEKIKYMNNSSDISIYKKYLSTKLNDKYSVNKLKSTCSYNGADQVIELLKDLIKEDKK